MTVGELFAGIGGLSLGLERAGFDVRWQVECDDYATTILERHWPAVPRRRDVRLAGADSLERVECIAGGFPCQDISAAGKGAGITGRRSGLWFEFARIVRELRPRWVIAENVPALRTRGADVVLADLEAVGYTCWPIVVGARHVGAPHRRDRVFIVARLADCNGEGCSKQRAADGGCRTPRDVVDRRSERRLWPARPGETQREWEPARTDQSDVGGAAYGLSARLASRRRRNELKALGNAVVPQVAELIGRMVLAVDAAMTEPA